jgi:hypothetical protein
MSNPEEEWDELMGPPPGVSSRSRSLGVDAPASSSSTNTTRSSSAGASAAQDDVYHAAIKTSASFDHDTIKQEALFMLEVSDADQNYDVYRTSTGGYSASAKPKTRAALSGLNLTSAATSSNSSNRSNHSRAWLDDMNSIATPSHRSPHYDDDDDDIVDHMAMERRALASRETEDRENKTNVCSIGQSSSTAKGGKNGKNWSSRYTIDNTLLAMTGGTVSKSSVSDMRVHNDPYSTSNARILDRMDKETKNTSSFTKGSVFGSAAAFNYRQNNVFGKQNVVLASTRQPNLQAAFIDKTLDANETSDMPPANARTRSWQDRVQQQIYRRRIICLIGMAIIFAAITGTSIYLLKTRLGQSSSESSMQSVTFYAISDTPIYEEDASKLYHELRSVGDETKFIIHLGNVQKASETGCTTERYQGIATTLKAVSTRPMFIIPGTEDYKNCADQDKAFQDWSDAFKFFEQNWDVTDPETGMTIQRDIETYHEMEHFENFAFVTDGVLCIGINEVGGDYSDHAEYKERNTNNYKWITGMINTHYNDIRSTVIFGNYQPGQQQNYELFGPLGDQLRTDSFRSMPILYVHGYSEDNDVTLYQPLLDVPNLKAVAANDGISRRPLRINIGFGSDPFIIG